jgi:hypothetical protein
LKGENNNPQEILFDVKLDLSSFFLILTQETATKKGKYSPNNIIYKKCLCNKCRPETMQESAESAKFKNPNNTNLKENFHRKLSKSTMGISAANRFKSKIIY